MNSLKVAVVGATGLVGQTILQVLEEREFPVSELRLFGARSAGAVVPFQGRSCTVEALGPETDLAGIELAFFAAGAEVSRSFASRFVSAGALVIDKSSAFRLDPKVPLVVPEVNGNSVAGHWLIATPNCSTIPLVVALAPVHQKHGLRWVSVSTYQSVSGAGKDALAEMQRQLHSEETPKTLPRRIAGNVFPENGGFDESGYGEEERKIAWEFKKILDDPKILISATSVRVPVAVGHSEAVAFETASPASLNELTKLFQRAAGVNFAAGSGYATPLEAAGTDDVFVGRLRPDTAHAGAYLMWLVSDNLRKGAATNAVQIAELALSEKKAIV